MCHFSILYVEIGIKKQSHKGCGSARVLVQIYPNLDKLSIAKNGGLINEQIQVFRLCL